MILSEQNRRQMDVLDGVLSVAVGPRRAVGWSRLWERECGGEIGFVSITARATPSLGQTLPVRRRHLDVHLAIREVAKLARGFIKEIGHGTNGLAASYTCATACRLQYGAV